MNTQRFNVALKGHQSKVTLELTEISEENALKIAEKLRELVLEFSKLPTNLDEVAKSLVQKYPDSKLAGVKEFKEVSGYCLREAKEYMDKFYDVLRKNSYIDEQNFNGL
jgi:hypothetical protein